MATAQLELDWIRWNIHVPLRIINSPYRDLSWPLVEHIRKHQKEHGSEIVTIYLPQYIVGHWWEHLLHNHRANRMRNKLMMEKGVSIALVPWLLDSSTLIYGRRSRAVAGDARRGEPRTPPVRSHLTPETVEIPTKRRRRRSGNTKS